MKNAGLTVGFVGLGILLGACSGGGEEPAPFASSSDLALESKLEADTGAKWHVLSGLEKQAPKTLAPIAPARWDGANLDERAKRFFSRYSSELSSGDATRELSAPEESTSQDGSRFVRYSHVIPGTQLPVFERGSGLSVHADGSVSMVEAGFGLDYSHTSTAPGLSIQHAKAKAADATGEMCGERGTVAELELGGYPDRIGAVRLAYRASLDSIGTCMAPVVYVDASTGATIVARDDAPGYYDTVKGGSSHYWNDASDTKTLDVSQNARFEWQLRTQMAPAPVETRDYRTSGILTSDRLGAWYEIDQGIAVDAHFHATRALDYFREAHGRIGVDGKGGALRVYVHDNSSGNFFGDNAHFNPSDGTIHLGDGNPSTNRYLPMALSFDVVVHELAHGVIARTSRLVYANDSGALNESFADVMAMSAKMWMPEARVGASFRLGEKSVNEKVYGHPYMRDMLSPMKGNISYYKYSKLEPCTAPTLANDYCGVHYASGVGNRAFAMMAVGGDEVAQNGWKIAVPEGIGFNQAAYVWYQAMTTLTNPRATYRDAAMAQIKVAERIGPAARTAVGCAWAAVDVLTPAEQYLWAFVCSSPKHVPKEASCSNIGNGAFCPRGSGSSVTTCKNGVTSGSLTCPGPKSRCVQMSPTDFRPMTDPSGKTVCK